MILLFIPTVILIPNIFNILTKKIIDLFTIPYEKKIYMIYYQLLKVYL